MFSQVFIGRDRQNSKKTSRPLNKFDPTT